MPNFDEMYHPQPQPAGLSPLQQFQEYALSDVYLNKTSAKTKSSSGAGAKYPAPAPTGFTFGCDPELFIQNLETGEFVSAEGIIPGTKEEPHKVKCGAVQVDGMAAEFNTDPASDFSTFDNNITMVMHQLQKFLPVGHSLVCKPAVVFSEKEWDKAPAKAKELGCSPDFNAWTGDVNPPPSDPDSPRLRTASGHLHVGWCNDATVQDPVHLENCRDLIKQFDYHLGAWSLTQDKDPVRRRLYGKAGAFRPKPYGAEYRVLSNFWITSSKGRLQVWNRMIKAIDTMRDRFMPEMEGAFEFNERLIQSIDTSVRDEEFEKKFHFLF